jgi:Spy/CpxP family protein refolding chaperone
LQHRIGRRVHGGRADAAGADEQGDDLHGGFSPGALMVPDVLTLDRTPDNFKGKLSAEERLISGRLKNADVIRAALFFVDVLREDGTIATYAHLAEKSITVLWGRRLRVVALVGGTFGDRPLFFVTFFRRFRFSYQIDKTFSTEDNEMSGNGKLMGKMVVMFSIAALTAFAVIAQAHTGEWYGEHCCTQQRHHCGKHLRHNFRKFAEKLGLTDAQKAQAKAIFQANRDAVKPMVENLRAERKNLRDLIHADKVDEAAIRAESNKIAAIQADLNVGRAKIGAQFRAILKPEQLAKLKALRQKREEAATPPPAK